MKRIVLVAALLALASRPAFAQSQAAGKAKAGRASTDQAFVQHAAGGGMAEVELGKLAHDKASSADVKAFGDRMVSDHEKANDELKQLAQAKNITLPAAIDKKEKALYDRLSKLSGAAFDRAYMNAMLADHKKVVAEFKRESSAGADPDVKAFAAKTLPTIEDHLKMAQTTDKAVVGTSGRK
jgi:putative membrane protein